MVQRRDFLARTAMGITASPWLHAWSAIAAEGRGDAQPPAKSLTAPALCVAPDVRAADAAAAILRHGGNAFDAIVAAAFVQGVVAPHNCGIGGYAATAIAFHAKTKSVVALDANAVAPRAATAGMFPIVAEANSLEYRFTNDKHKRGPLSIAVPGVLAGLLKMLETWGSLDLKTVMAPAIAHARSGVALAPEQASAWLTMQAEAAGLQQSGGEPPKRVRMDELAETLETIADEGGGVFYSGRIGRRIADYIGKRGGIVTLDDLAAYRALVVEPLTVEVRGHLLSTPPPGAGGLTSLQIIALYDRLARRGAEPPFGGSAAIENLLEISKVVWEERLTQFGDVAAMARPPQTFLADDHLEGLAARVAQGLAHPGPGRTVAADPLKGTAHLAAADAAGNLVALTLTHGGAFGSRVMVPGTSIVLGHGMCRFEPRPGWVNSIAPGKRPLHNMTPIIAVKQSRPVLAIGASGGRTIVNNCANLAIGHLIYGLSAVEAVAAPRWHCETKEPAIIESTAGSECIMALRARGHAIQEIERAGGAASLIVRERDAWTGAAEPRRESTAVVADHPAGRCRTFS